MIPQLRFPQYIDEWEEKKIKDIGYFYYGKSAPKHSLTSKANGVPCVRYGELYSKFSGIVDQIHSYTSIEKSQLKLSKGGEVLVPRVGEDPKDFNKCSWLPYPDVAIGEMISVFNTKQNPKFISVYFRARMMKEFGRLVEGFSVSNLYYYYLENVRMNLPSEPEQERIADFVFLINDNIENQKKKLELANEYKKGLLQKLFPKKGQTNPELRFKNDDDSSFPEWEESKLRNIFQESNKKGGSRASLLSIKINGGVQKFDENERKNNSSESLDNYKVVDVGDIAYNSMRMWQGASGVSKYNGIVSPAYTVIKAAPEQIPLFWGYYFKLPSLVFLFQRYSQGLTSDTWNIKFKQLSEINVAVPDKIEQQKIADIITKIDEKIEDQERKLEEAKRFKKALLQQMFV